MIIMKNKKLITIISVIIVVLVLLLIIIITLLPKKSGKKVDNPYKWEFAESVEVPEGYYKAVLDNEEKANKCIDDVCVNSIVIVFNDTLGVVKYELVNNSKKTIRDGYYYLKLSNDERVLVYVKKLKKGETYNGEAYYKDMNMYNVTSYKFVNLTKKELKNVK